MKDNKLLAEYLGLYKEIVEDHKLPDSFPRRLFTNEGNEWQPNSDWNQLMMVVEKIEKTVRKVRIEEDECMIFIPHEKVCTTKNSGSKIMSVYDACMQVIKYGKL